MSRNLLLLFDRASPVDAPTYSHRILALTPIAYYPLNEPNGTVAVDLSGNGYNGTYTGAVSGGVGVGEGNTAALYDGTDDVITVLPVSAAFDGNAGTLLLWGQTSAAVWVDGTVRYLARLQADSTNFIAINRTGISNQLQFRRVAGGTTKQVFSVVLAGTEAPFCLALTWDTVANQVKAYISGVQVGATGTSINTFAGALSTAAIGAQNDAAQSSWSGILAHVAIFNRALTSAEILDISVL